MSYISPAISGPLNTPKRGREVKNGSYMGADYLHYRCRLRGPQCFEVGDKVAKLVTSLVPFGRYPTFRGWDKIRNIHMWAHRLHHPCGLWRIQL